MVGWRLLEQRHDDRAPRSGGGVRAREVGPRLGRRLACCGIVLLLGFAAALGAILWDMRQTALRDGYRVVALKGVTVAEQTARAVQAVDLVVQNIRAEVLSHPLDGPLGDDARLKSPPFQIYLRDSLRNLPQLQGLSVVDARGRVIAWSRSWPAGDVTVTDREYFRHFRMHADAEPFLNAPVRSHVDGSWTFFLARRIEDGEHRLLGVVAAALSIPYFDDFYRAVTDNGTESVTLLRQDGILFARFPATADQVGQAFMHSPLWPGTVAAGGGEYVTRGYHGDPARLISVHPLSAYPLVVDVGLKRVTALGAWRHTATVIIAGALLTAIVLGVLLRLLCLQLHKLESQRLALVTTANALRESERRLHENARQLATTLTHMDQGLMMVDAELNVVVCNARAMELLDLPPELMAKRPHFSVVLRHQFAAEEFRHTEIRAGGAVRRAEPAHHAADLRTHAAERQHPRDPLHMARRRRDGPDLYRHHRAARRRGAASLPCRA